MSDDVSLCSLEKRSRVIIPYTDRRLRPFLRRRARTFRPFFVALLFRKPCLVLRFLLDGWYVLFIRLAIIAEVFVKSSWNDNYNHKVTITLAACFQNNSSLKNKVFCPVIVLEFPIPICYNSTPFKQNYLMNNFVDNLSITSWLLFLIYCNYMQLCVYFSFGNPL
jgi:hypothetical protein